MRPESLIYTLKRDDKHPPFASCQLGISSSSSAEEWWNQSLLCYRAKEMSSFLFCQQDAAWTKLFLSLSFLFSQKCSLSIAKQSSSISSSGNNTPENLTTPSSSIDQRTVAQSADKLTLLSAENASVLRSAEKTFLQLHLHLSKRTAQPNRKAVRQRHRWTPSPIQVWKP